MHVTSKVKANAAHGVWLCECVCKLQYNSFSIPLASDGPNDDQLSVWKKKILIQARGRTCSNPPVPTGMEELRRWSPLLICMVPSPRLVHTPNSVAITLEKDEEKEFDNFLSTEL